jgi:hypothetical protein
MNIDGAPVTGAPSVLVARHHTRTNMRYTLSHLKLTENLPNCPACGATMVFADAADVGRDGRVNLIFRCTNCSAGEAKIWRPEYQAMADLLAADE